MRSRRLPGVSLLFLALAGLAPLEPGAAREREVAGGEVHAWEIAGREGLHVLVRVEPEGIDLSLAAFDPNGKAVAEVDAREGERGREALLLSPAAEGTWRIEVRAKAGGRPGRYRIEAEELAVSTPEDEKRLSAERLVLEAAQLAAVRTAEGRREAVARHEAALALWRELGRRREEAEALTALGDLARALGEADRAAERYAGALPLWEGLDDRGEQADALLRLGLARLRAAPEEAEPLFRRGLDLYRALGEHHGEADARSNLCLALQVRGEPETAASCYEEALGFFKEEGLPERTLLLNLGEIHLGLGEADRAVARFEEALAQARSAGDREREAQILGGLAVAWRSMGETGRALSEYDRVLAVLRETGDRAGEARTLNSLGYLHLGLGDNERARFYFEESLALRRALRDRRGEAITLGNLGQALDRLGEPQRAIELYRQALGLARAVEDKRTEGICLSHLGQALAATGSPEESTAALAAALEIQREAGDLGGQARTLYRAGLARLAGDEPAAARARFEEALTLRRTLGDSAGQAEVLVALARAERRLGRPGEARARLEEALAFVESLRRAVASPELRATLLAARRDAYELYVDTLLTLDALEPGRGHALAALEASETSRARALLDLLAEARADLHREVDPGLAERAALLRRQIQARAGRRTELASTAGARSAERIDKLDREVEDLLAEMARIEETVRGRSPHYAALAGPHTLRAAGIQALLGPETLLLEYSLGEERSFLWAVDAGAVQVFPLPRRSEIEPAVRRVHEAWRTADPRGVPEQALAAELSRLLLGPVAGLLKDRRLAIVPDGALHLLPFAALPSPEPGGGVGEPLLVRHEIVTLPSASVLAALRLPRALQPDPAREIAVIADPVFSADDPRVERPAPAAAPAGAPAFQRLPATRREAEVIAALRPAGRVRLALDFAASREAVLSGDLAGWRVVHFATHGVLDLERPALSGLVLSGVDAAGRPRDGFLSLGDVYSLRLGADLVVLSGCETALGREVRGEGLLGLTRGFMYAGAPRVLATLWPVRDRATSELMSRFYRALLEEGMPPAAALRSAQLSLRADRRWRAPYFWAAFTLQGDWLPSTNPAAKEEREVSYVSGHGG